MALSVVDEKDEIRTQDFTLVERLRQRRLDAPREALAERLDRLLLDRQPKREAKCKFLKPVLG